MATKRPTDDMTRNFRHRVVGDLRSAVARYPLPAGLIGSAVILGILLAIVLVLVAASTATVVAVMAAFLAAYFGAAQLWIAVVIGDAQKGVAEAAADAERERAENQERRRKDRYERLKFETAYEAAHNLQHLAALTTNGLLDRSKSATVAAPQVFAKNRWPQFHTLQARRLLDDSFEDLFRRDSPDGELWARIDHLIRNDDYLAHFDFTPVGLARAEEVAAYFVEYCIRVLIDGARLSPRGARIVRSLCIESLSRVVDESPTNPT